MSLDTHAPLLVVDGLTVALPKGRNDVLAVDRVSFSLAHGEVLGLVGESGAGKSMIAAALLGLLAQPARMTAGSIHLDGVRIDGLPERQRARVRGRQIGWVPQESLNALDPLYTVEQQLVETLHTHDSLSAKQAQNEALALLDAVGLPATVRTLRAYAHQLSGGMRQRVVIALALAAHPKILVADEPTTALDVSTQSQVIDVLKRLCRERNMSMLFITHDVGALRRIADRIAVLYAGLIVELGKADQLLQFPQHPYTAGLIGAIPSFDVRKERLFQIEGCMPRLGERAVGCSFHPRCPHRFAPCDAQPPPLIQTGSSQVACWLYRQAETPDAKQLETTSSW